MKIKEISDVTGFEGIKLEWDDLLQRSEEPTVFQTWEWNFIWWEHYAKGKELFLITIYGQDNKLIGLAPFYIAKKQFGILYVCVVEYIGYGENKNSEYLNLIIDKQYVESVTNTIIDYLLKIRERYQILHLTNIIDGSNILKAIILSLNIRNVTIFQENNLGCPFIELPESMDEFLATFKGKRRGGLKNLRKQLYEKHEVEIIQWNSTYDINKGINILFDLHKARFECDSVFYSDRNNAFIKDVLNSFHKNDFLRLFFMKINGEFACAMCCFELNNILLYYQTGYNPKWTGVSALRILIYEVIEIAIRNKNKMFDFGRGVDQYKLVWTKNIKQTKDIWIFQNRLLAYLFSAQRKFIKLIKMVLLKRNDK